MIPKSRRLKLSLAAKNAIGYFILFLLAIGLTGFFMLKSSSTQLIEASEQNLRHDSELVKLRFEKFLEELKFDISHLSQSPVLLQFISQESESNYQLLKDEYLSLVRSKPHFAQLRFIGLQDNGRELVRVDRKNKEVLPISKDSLQEKGNRSYFINTVELPPDSLYVSEIDLNKEYGKLSEPYVPTLRMAYPVYFNSVLKGIIVVNTDLRPIFDELRSIVGPNYNLSLLNGEGYYLLNDNPDLEFEFEFNKKPSFVNTFGDKPINIANQTDRSILDIERQLYRFLELDFPREAYGLFIMLDTDKDSLLSSYFKWRNRSFLFLGLASLLFILIASLLMNRQVGELKSITGNIRTFSDSFQPVTLPENRNDEIGALASSFNKMSKRINESIAELKLARDSAESAVKEKQEFIENMSHEIRNPIQSIMGLSELLSKNNPQDHQVSLIESIRLSTVYLQSLTNDILDYKKLLDGDITLNMSWHSLQNYIDQLEKLFSYSALLKKQALTFDLDASLTGHSFRFDSIRLNQIMTNLIMNAIKYTPEEGSINVIVKELSSSDGSSEISFMIKDTGLGMDRNTLESVQKRYFKGVEKNFVDSFGLGLSIVKGILKLFNSDLEVKSVQGKGSEFAFKLKLDKSNNSKASSKAKTEITYEMNHISSVLILEDDPQILNLYAEIFSKLPVEIQMVGTLSELNKFDGKKFDAMLLDYRVGDKLLTTKIDLIRSMMHQYTQVVIVSAQSLDAIDLDLDYSYLQKPFSSSDLIAELSAPAAVSVEQADFSSIFEDYDGDQVKYANAIGLLESEWSKSVSRIRESMLNNNQNEFDAVVHKLITSIRRLKLYRLETLIENFNLDESNEKEKSNLLSSLETHAESIQSELS